MNNRPADLTLLEQHIFDQNRRLIEASASLDRFCKAVPSAIEYAEQKAQERNAAIKWASFGVVACAVTFGGATAEKVTEAFKIMLKNPGLKAILVNIFGGIMRCDVIAEGVIAAVKAVSLNVPLVVRMKGTNEDLGKKMLADSGLPIIAADTMEDAAKSVVAAAAGQA